MYLRKRDKSSSDSWMLRVGNTVYLVLMQLVSWENTSVHIYIIFSTNHQHPSRAI